MKKVKKYVVIAMGLAIGLSFMIFSSMEVSAKQKATLSKKAKKAFEMILSNPSSMDDRLEDGFVYGVDLYGSDFVKEWGEYAYYDIDNDGCKELLISIPSGWNNHEGYSFIYDFDEKKSEATSNEGAYGWIYKVSKNGIMVRDRLNMALVADPDICDVICYTIITEGIRYEYECKEVFKSNNGERYVAERKYYTIGDDGVRKAISEQKYDKAVKKMKFKTPKWKSISSFKR